MMKKNNLKTGRKVIAASAIDRAVFRLGRKSFRNVHEFSPVEACIVPLPARTNLVRRSEVARDFPVLAEESRSYCLPPLFAAALGIGEAVQATSSGRRSLYRPSRYPLNLKELGWTEEDVQQEFFVDVKGSGIRLRDAETVSEQDFRRFAERHGIKRFDHAPVADQLVFSRNQYYKFLVPEGAQDRDIGDNSFWGFEYFSARGFKLAIPICRISYPKAVQRFAKEFDKEEPLEGYAMKKPLEGYVLAQEKRLMPSHVRMAYFENNPGRNEELLRLISDDESVLQELPARMLEDMVRYFEILAETTERRGRGFSWDFLPTLTSVFEDPANLFEKPYGWYVAKDIVVAGTGLYFVDLEDVCVDARAKNLETLRMRQQLYLTVLLKDFSRFLAHYAIALEDEHDPKEQQRIERKVMDDLVSRLNASDCLTVEQNKRAIRVTLHYQQLRKGEFAIDREHLPVIYQ
ncbi:hypothetical protein HYS48_04785 [Candidatus Woesearchaeota archaeon]|nr:hypothetical protein [Candidatus Woesearchaeota archaeon]